MEYVKLSNGSKMPKVGLGLWKGGDPSDLEEAIDAALEAGYRLFDTAFVYGTEDVLGKCIKKWITSGKGKREDLFIITKLPWNGMERKKVDYFLSTSLKELDLEYVDLYLVHWPQAVKHNGDDREFFPTKKNGDTDVDFDTDLVDLWRGMESAVDSGKAKAIGVSNFTNEQLARILKTARILPSNNQVEVHAYFQQKELISLHAKLGVTVTAYSPLGGPWRRNLQPENELPDAVNLLDDPNVKTIAQKHGKTSGQILLKYLLQLGVSIVPKSSKFDRLKQNIGLYDFNLDAADFQKLEAMDRGEEGRSNFLPFKSDKPHPETPFFKNEK